MKSKIIICDDDEGILEAMDMILRGEGYDVKTLTSGEHIEEEVKSFDPQLVLLDLWLGNEDGKILAKALHDNPETRSIPVVIISALNDVGNLAEENHITGFISKPFEMVELLRSVSEYISQSPRKNIGQE